MSLSSTVLLVSLTMLLGCSASDPWPKATKTRPRAEWLAEGSYGVMVHYFPTPMGNTPSELTADFNRKLDAFDLDTFINQFEETKADWLIFTMGQNTGYFNSPNAWLDGRAAGFTPRRDLMLAIAQRVKQRGKRFIIYISAQAPQSYTPLNQLAIAEVQQAFAWDKKDLSAFTDRYLEFVKAYALKFGKLCDGWWFDGCYPTMFKPDTDWSRWTAASRAGNPDAIVAFNDGAFCAGKEKPVSPLQDYHAGEVHLLEQGRIRFDYIASIDQEVNADGYLVMKGATQPPKHYMPTAQYVDGVQWHALVPVDSTFTPTVPLKYTSYSPATLIQFVRDCRQVRGAVTYNLPVGPDGHIPPSTAEKMGLVGQGLAK